MGRINMDAHRSVPVTIHYSDSRSCPKCGSSVHISGRETEYVNIHVRFNTTPFENSIDNCKHDIGVLTGAVVATESAQVASIRNNAMKVGQTIVSGFFKTVRSEISQQISELSSRIDATLLHLHELAKRCVDKQRQMETDYHRISSRYLKTFDELNRELENRIFELDKPAFLFRQMSDDTSVKTLSSDLASTVAVSGTESSALQVRLSASVAKHRALDTIGRTNNFLLTQKRTEDILHQCILDENVAATRFKPVCYIEAYDESNVNRYQIYQNEKLGNIKTDELFDGFCSQNWHDLPTDEREQIRCHFNIETGNRYNNDSEHEMRVKNYITSLFNKNNIKSV